MHTPDDILVNAPSIVMGQGRLGNEMSLFNVNSPEIHHNVQTVSVWTHSHLRRAGSLYVQVHSEMLSRYRKVVTSGDQPQFSHEWQHIYEPWAWHGKCTNGRSYSRDFLDDFFGLLVGD